MFQITLKEVAERLWTGWEDERIEKNENSGTAVDIDILF